MNLGKDRLNIKPFTRFKKPLFFLVFILAIFANFLFSNKDNQKFSEASLQAALLNADLVNYFDFSHVEAYSGDFVVATDQPKAVLTESPELLLAQNNTLVAVSTPNTLNIQTLASVSGELEQGFVEQRDSIIEYEVKQGDSLSGIAESFGISLNTLLWANDLSGASKLKEGQKLVILPVSGILHYVKSKDTLSQISKTYKGDLNEIIAFNQLDGSDDIYIGDIVIVPGGVMPSQATAKSQSKQAAQSSSVSTSKQEIPVGSSYFLVPVSTPYILTQGAHFHNAVDFGHSGGSPATCGRPVYASAGGQITRASGSGAWNGGAGNLVLVLHPNQAVTAYFHLDTVFVSSGQTVSAGQQIGTIGKTGNATGCHLHFEVRGATNPFIR